jgi:hypothetical protein
VAVLPPAASPAGRTEHPGPGLGVFAASLRAGDQIRVTLDDGRRHQGRFVAADAERLVIEDDEQWTSIELATVVEVEERRTDVVATTVLAVGVAAAAIVGIVALAWDYPGFGPVSTY